MPQMETRDNRKWWHVCLSLLIVGLLTACETGPARQDIVDKADKELEAGQKSQKKVEGVPDDVRSALIPSIQLGTSEMPDIEDEQRFDISVNNVPADQFFMSLVDGTPYNIVVHPEVSGTISLNLDDVSVPDVLEAVRDVYGYEFVSTPYGFQVLPGRIQARIYQINHLNIKRTGDSRTVVSSGSIASGERGGSGSSRGGRAGNDQFQSSGTRGSGNNVTSILGTEINTEQPQTTFWEELQTSLEAIVGQAEGRSVVVNPQSGVVVVRALPTELREVESYLEATQLMVQRQVILEAKIIEVTLNEGHQTGINWSGLIAKGDDSVRASNIGGGSVLVDQSGVSNTAGNALDLANLTGAEGAVSSAFGGVFSLAFDIGDFGAFIELLRTQGNVQVLSSPRVSTTNNQKAVIKVGTDEFFVTDVTTTTVTGTATTVTPSVTLTPFFSGIALDVTPQISQDGWVTLHVHPSVSEVTDQQKTVTIGQQTQQLPLALSTVRETDSIVRAKSGQVVVIGGLMQDRVDDEQAGTPILSDIPLLGQAFKQTRQRSTKSELVILLRPVVVDSGDDWDRAMESSRQSLDRLRKTMDQQEWIKDRLPTSQGSQ